MAKAVVLLFLLDSLPDFNNVINTTLRKLPGMIGVCDSTISAPVLQVIGKKLNLSDDSVERLQNIDHNHYPSYKFQELSPESVNDVGFQDNSIQESYEFSVEKSPNYIEHKYKKNYTNKNEDGLESTADLKSKSENENRTGLPESAPFLAAIFETVGNVTAQTCGGVVLSQHWVLTAASCVNVLGPFYTNSSNETLDNYYSIVAGAKDPLKDGTVHQVSKIYLHPTPQPNQSERRTMRSWFDSVVRTRNDTAPRLALLRVEPGIQGGMLQMMQNKTDWDGVNARIYGWILIQNQTGFEMQSASLPAKQLSAAECRNAFGIVENNTIRCLTVNETASNHTRMSSGCPVVVLQNGRPTLLAVALTDGTQPLLASPLSAHREWLVKLTRDYGNSSSIN